MLTWVLNEGLIKVLENTEMINWFLVSIYEVTCEAVISTDSNNMITILLIGCIIKFVIRAIKIILIMCTSIAT